MGVMNISEWIRSIAFSVIQHLTVQQAHPVILINVTNMGATVYIVFIAGLRVRVQPLPLAIPINVMNFNREELQLMSMPYMPNSSLNWAPKKLRFLGTLWASPFAAG